ncbi:MAG TPA: hypothetical protein VLZ89_07085 [Anaerolineales bacterium]|nr:hypothetical protein [Anaerolineales bacterium]
MKIRALFLALLSAVVLVLAVIAIPVQSASAKTCYDTKTKKPIPCPQQQAKPTATDAPATATDTPVPQPTETAAPKPTGTAAPSPAPDAGQLALMCTSAGFVPKSGTGGDGNSDLAAPGGIVPQNPGLLGGGGVLGILIGLLVGVLIGLLLPAVQRSLGGNGRGKLLPAVNRGGVFDKRDEAGVVIAIQPGGEHGIVDPMMGDGSVHPSNEDAAALFIKRGGAGITDGTSFTGGITLGNPGGQTGNLARSSAKLDDWEDKRDDWQDKRDDWEAKQDGPAL